MPPSNKRCTSQFQNLINAGGGTVLFNTCAVQHLCPLELRCVRKTLKEENENQLEVNAKEFRPRRNAAAVATVKVNDQIKNEHEVPDIE